LGLQATIEPKQFMNSKGSRHDPIQMGTDAACKPYPMAKSRINDPNEPLTLENMRHDGVRSLDSRAASVAIDHLPGDLTLPSFGPRIASAGPSAPT
jgi:hypothetical protein